MIDLLHKITQLGFIVSFNEDFEGMIRVDFTEEYPNPTDPFYHHEHLGFPDATMEQLDKAVIKSLTRFYEKYGESKL
jgi:hypothetical protein